MTGCAVQMRSTGEGEETAQRRRRVNTRVKNRDLCSNFVYAFPSISPPLFYSISNIAKRTLKSSHKVEVRKLTKQLESESVSLATAGKMRRAAIKATLALRGQTFENADSFHEKETDSESQYSNDDETDDSENDQNDPSEQEADDDVKSDQDSRPSAIVYDDLDEEDRIYLAQAQAVLNARSSRALSHLPNRSRTDHSSRPDVASTPQRRPDRLMVTLPSISMSRASGMPARQNVRNGIVQQWQPNFPRTNGTTHNQHVQAPPTPPTNEEDKAEIQRRELEHQIMLSVDENGIERPKDYTVSFHYNRRVENMHFGVAHPMKPWRLTLTKHLVMGYGLQFAMDNYEALPATKEAVEAFHDPEYVDFLSKVSPQTFDQLCNVYANRIPPGSSDDIVKLGPFNLSVSPGADCPVFDGMSEYFFTYTGATMEAVHALVNHQSDIAINWSGGLHHAHKSEASGFCYINDIVLAILELLKTHQRVLYIDIDVHHGDGVEEAFNSSDRVMTISFHRFGTVQDVTPPHLFFPGTGAVSDNGNTSSIGHHFALNVPISAGIDDEQYTYLFQSVVGEALKKFRPGAIVLQCGADSLGGDRLGQFNLNIKAHGECLAFVKKQRIPLLILGGGGYTARNVARAWCHETALAVGATLTNDLPLHILPRPQAFEGKGHGDGRLYPELKGFHNNEIKRKELDEIIEKCVEELRYVQHAPSVVMDSLPSAARMEQIRRQIDEELEADKAEESRRHEAGRKRKERNTAGRGEYRGL